MAQLARNTCRNLKNGQWRQNAFRLLPPEWGLKIGTQQLVAEARCYQNFFSCTFMSVFVHLPIVDTVLWFKTHWPELHLPTTPTFLCMSLRKTPQRHVAKKNIQRLWETTPAFWRISSRYSQCSARRAPLAGLTASLLLHCLGSPRACCRSLSHMVPCFYLACWFFSGTIEVVANVWERILSWKRFLARDPELCGQFMLSPLCGMPHRANLMCDHLRCWVSQVAARFRGVVYSALQQDRDGPRVPRAMWNCRWFKKAAILCRIVWKPG